MKINKLTKQDISAISELLMSEPETVDELQLLSRKIAKKHKTAIAGNAAVLGVYREMVKRGDREKSANLEKLLRKRAIRTLSGIAPVAVLTKPFACPGKCAYCPTEKDVPQSYLSNEPAVMRAIRCEYDPYVQVSDRLQALESNGHEPTKIELIVIGGTWSVLPKEYKYWYIANCFAAANNFKFDSKATPKKISDKLSIEELERVLLREQKRNEKAKYKIIGLTLETRPDYINDKELDEMRVFGCTRVELGVQAIDDDILELNKRGHGVNKIAQATALLRDYGFKVTYHLMPGLPGSSVKKDISMFKRLFNDERFQPDQIKFYPTVVTKGSLLYKWWQKGEYKPYTDKQLEKLIIDCKKIVPRYVRIIRLIRDIPGESIIAGNKITNLRQVMKQRGVDCNCIRCRESKDQEVKDFKIKAICYAASGGTEYFIEVTDETENVLYGFCRLRLPKNSAAIIRELHVYGELVSVGGDKKTQHAGLGKMLLAKAEEIAKQRNYENMSVISGVGVRGYYRKLGFKLKQTYMVKRLGK